MGETREIQVGSLVYDTVDGLMVGPRMTVRAIGITSPGSNFPGEPVATCTWYSFVPGQVGDQSAEVLIRALRLAPKSWSVRTVRGGVERILEYVTEGEAREAYFYQAPQTRGTVPGDSTSLNVYDPNPVEPGGENTCVLYDQVLDNSQLTRQLKDLTEKLTKALERIAVLEAAWSPQAPRP